MKKMLQMLALAVLIALPPRAVATSDTLTVANGTATEAHIPLYGYWADYDQHNQIVYPASLLSAMVGQNITGLKIYVTGSWSLSNAVISLAIVDNSTLAGLNTSASFVQVWSGPLNGSFEIGFSNAFEYSGGNLLLDIQTTGGSYSTSSAQGITSPSASYYSYMGSGSVVNFLPKTDFFFSDDEFCFAPTALTLDVATTGSLAFHWSHGSNENEWEVMVGDSLIQGIVDTFVTVNDLVGSTVYTVKVRAMCGMDNYSTWTMAEMQTQCASISQLPVTYTFEGDADGDMPLCWSRPEALYSMNWLSGSMDAYPIVYNSSYMSHNGMKCIYFSAYNASVGDGPAYAVTPYIAGNPSQLHITYWMQSEGLGEYITLEAGVMDDPTDTSTFVALSTVNADPDGYALYEFNTSTLTGYDYGDSICIAFRVVVIGDGSGDVVIDDVVIDELDDCIAPRLASGSIDSVSYDAVRLSWSCDNTPDSYDVILASATDTLHYYATDTTILILNLTGNTTYEASVASVCGSAYSSYITIGQFTTNYRCYAVTSPTVAAVTANAAVLQWNLTGTGGIAPTAVEITLMDLTDSLLLPTVTVTDTNAYTFTDLVANHRYRASFLVICGDSDSSTVKTTTFMPHGAPCAEFRGNINNNQVPFHGFYKYGYSQQLYADSLLGNLDTINGISFEVATPRGLGRNIDIYLGYTTQTNLTPTSYIPFSQMTKVVSNYYFIPNTEGWLNMIPFDTVFVRADTGNLVVAVSNNTGSYQSGLVWKCDSVTVGTSIRWYTDSAPIDPDNTSATPTSLSVAPNIQLFGNCGSGCMAPSVTVTGVDTGSVSLEWLAGGDEDSWLVQYHADTATEWVTSGTATATVYTVTGLDPATEYFFRVGSLCDDTAYSSILSATTACAPVHAGYSVQLRTNSTCWSYLPGGSYYYSTSQNSLYLYTDYAAIISPAIGDSLNAMQVRIVDCDLYDDGIGYDVGVCNAEGGNITWIQSVTATPSVFGTHVVYLNGYTGSENHIILKNNGGSSVYIRSFAIEPIGDCLPVTSLALDSVSTTDAWLSWHSSGSTFEVRYRTDAVPTWTTLTVTDTVAHLTGLAHSTHYDVEVRLVCSSAGMSDSATLSFTTVCANASVPFSEAFTGFGLPACWNTLAGNVFYNWAETAENGEGYVYSYAGSGSPANDWIMTPVIDIPADAAASNICLVYAIGGGSDAIFTSSLAAYQVLASVAGNSSPMLYTDTLFVDTVNTVDASQNYTLEYRRIPLGSYAGQSVSFAFRSLARYAVVLLGDVSVRSTVNPLYQIYGNTNANTGEVNTYIAEYQEGDTNGMTLAWTSAMAAAGQAVMTNANSDTMQIVYSVAGVDTITFIATNSHGADTLSGVVLVYQCDVVNTFPWSEGFDSENSIACWRQQGTNEWTIGSGDSRDGVTPHSGAANVRLVHDNYSTSLLISPVLDLSNVANATLKFWHLQHQWSGDQDELFVLGRASAGDPWVVLASFISDISTWTLDSVALNSNSPTFQFAFEGHDEYGYGIAIDDLVVEGAYACFAPVVTGFVSGETTVAVSYTANADSVEMIICTGTFDVTMPSVVVGGGSHTFTGLDHGTAYIVGLRSLCSATTVSDWTIDTVSTILIDCQTPTALNVQATTYTTATIGWTSNGMETVWGIRAYNTLDTLEYTAPTNPFTLTGLISGTTYNIQVRALCGQNSDIEGEWSDAIQATADVCSGVDGVNVSDITSSSAKVNWRPAAGSIGYRIYYGVGNFNDNEAAIANVGSNDSSYTMAGLYADTPYEVYLVNVCTETGVVSHPTAADRVGFTTAAATEGIYDVESGLLTLFPNPASSSVTLTVSGFDGEAMVEVVDMNGRTVSELTTVNSELKIDVSTLAQGAYFVRVTGERQTAVRKLIVR